MDVTTPTRPVSAEVPNWDWQRELKSLDSALAAAERQTSWDWQRDLAELEARLESLAKKHGLAV